jgi:serine/threonine protein phosphatase PrpC
MIAEANRRGGLDNITAIVVRIDAADQPTGETPAITGATGAKN